MYKKSAQGWLKHWDFIFMDLLCLQISFAAACMIWLGGFSSFNDEAYRNEAFVLILCQVAVAFFGQSFRDILKRGAYTEFSKTMRHVCAVMLLALFHLFITRQLTSYSRMTFLLTTLFYFILAYASRQVLKSHLITKGRNKAGKRSLVIITVSDLVDSVLSNIRINPYESFAITGIVLLDKKLTGQYIKGVPVVADHNTVKDYVCREWVDEVFLHIPGYMDYPRDLIAAFITMGVTVHLSLNKIESISGGKQHVERLGAYSVLTTSMNMASSRQALYKRLVDITGGVVGCLITVVLFIFAGPVIRWKTHDSVFVSQIRVGQNGRKFKIYKFRSIGSGSAADEFPQFWNVLKGDMSLVGTRPATLEEWEQYDIHHRARMAIKPGITGMWQVSGENDITDIEDLVKLDTQYIENWNLGLDFKILFKTVGSVFHKSRTA